MKTTVTRGSTPCWLSNELFIKGRCRTLDSGQDGPGQMNAARPRADVAWSNAAGRAIESFRCIAEIEWRVESTLTRSSLEVLA